MIHPGHRRVLELVPRAPFHFDSSMGRPDHFRSPDNAWAPGVRWQAARWRGTPLGLKLENRGTVAEPCVRLSVFSHEALERPFLDSLAEEVSWRCNLRQDLGEFNRRFRADAQLGPVIRRWRGLRPACYSSLYEYLVTAILLQNCAARRSAGMMAALLERYGTEVAFEDRQLFCFWNPTDLTSVSEEELRALNVGYRAKSLVEVTRTFACGEVDEEELRDAGLEEQRRALLALSGIGPALVGRILFDVFHHVDQMDHISLWERRIYTKVFLDGNPDKPATEDRLLRLFDRRFRGYRGLAVHYIREDLFWRRQRARGAQFDWLDKLIRMRGAPGGRGAAYFPFAR